MFFGRKFVSHVQHSHRIQAQIAKEKVSGDFSFIACSVGLGTSKSTILGIWSYDATCDSDLLMCMRTTVSEERWSPAEASWDQLVNLQAFCPEEQLSKRVLKSKVLSPWGLLVMLCVGVSWWLMEGVCVELICRGITILGGLQGILGLHLGHSI